MSWLDWLLVSFLGALGAGLVVAVLTLLVEARLRAVRSVVLVDGPYWAVRGGAQNAFIEAVGLTARASDGMLRDVRLRGQRPYALTAPGAEGSRQGEVIRVESGQTLYFGPTEDVLGALQREGVDVSGPVVKVRAFVKVQGRDRLRHARRWCRYNWSTRKVQVD